jgi:GNAT superfamily N-acetyltransferase
MYSSKDCEKVGCDADFSILSNKSGEKIHIGNIMGHKKNRGYGSILMRYLKKLAIKEGTKCITGNLVSNNFDHLNRLKHFYSKHGFTVRVKDGSLSGNIEWNYFDLHP